MASSTIASDLPAASGLTGQTSELPEPGEYPHLDVQTQVPIVVGISSTFLVLSTIVVGLRLYTRYGLIKVAGDDDITIGVAQVRTTFAVWVENPTVHSLVGVWAEERKEKQKNKCRRDTDEENWVSSC